MMTAPEARTADVPLGARILRAAFLTASAWTFGAIWAAWAAIRIMEPDWTKWLPGWAHRPADYAFWLLKETYLPILGMLTLIWCAWIFAPVGRWRWVVATVALAMAATYLCHSVQVVRE
jgi:hypothetical protein